MTQEEVRNAVACLVAAVRIKGKVRISDQWQILRHAGLLPVEAEQVVDITHLEGRLARTDDGHSVLGENS